MPEHIEKSSETLKNSEKIQHLIKLARTLLETNIKEAKKHIAKALFMAKEKNDQENVCRVLNLFADFYRRDGKIRRSFKCCQESLRISQVIGNKKLEATSNMMLGLTFWHKGEFDKANPYFEIALKLYKELKDQEGTTKAYNNLSIVHWEMGELEKALKYQELCLELELRLGNSQAVGISYLNLGLIYEDLGDWEKSIEYFFRSLVEKERNQDRAGIVLCYNNIGEIYLKRRRLDKALKFFKEAIRLTDETDSLQNKAEVLGNMGYVHFLTDDLVSAITLYNEDMDISLKLDDKEELAETCRRMAQLLILTESQKCLSFLRKALRFANYSGSRKEIGNIKRVYGKYFSQIGNYSEAENSFKESIEILKSMSKGYELAETFRDYGKYLVERGTKQEGINYLKESARIFDGLDIPVESEAVDSFLIQLEGEKEKGLSLLKKVSALTKNISSVKEFIPNCQKLFYDIIGFQDGFFWVFGHQPTIIGSINPDEVIKLCNKLNIQLTPTSILLPLQAGNDNIGVLYFKWTKERSFSLEPVYWEITANIISLELEKMKILSEIESQQLKKGFIFKGVIGETEALKEILDIIERAAPTNAPVLIRGESGTGKELIAKTIHEMSSRTDKPFITINCSAIPDTLLESELFGIEQGTATGVSGRKGKFEQANNGTIFLDEIGDMSLPLQAKILRVLQEMNFERVGGRKSIKVDIRLIAATNKVLENEIKKGNFRDDLYHRLNVISIFLPPLKDRKQDISQFVEYFIEKFAKEIGKPVKGVSSEVLQSFLAYSWPGNIREMENVLERAIILSKSDHLSLDDLPPQFKQVFKTQLISTDSFKKLKEVKRKAREENLFPLEKDLIIKTLVENKYNVTKAASAVGISRGHFYRLMKNFRIQRRKYQRRI